MNVLRIGYFPSKKELLEPNAIITHGLALTHVFPLSREIEKLGVNQFFYSGGGFRAGSFEEINGFKVFRTMLPQKPFYLPYSLSLALNFKKIEKKTGGIDIIHSHNPAYAYGFALPFFSRFFPEKPLVITSHGTFPYFSHNSVDLFFIKKLLKKSYFIAISKPSKEQLLFLGAKKERIRLITTGTNTDFFKPGNFERSDILFVGRLVKSKNVETLIKAIKHVLKVNNKIKLRIVGSGEQKASLRQLAKKIGVAKNVLFLGSMQGKKLALEYAKAKICVFPHLHNSFGKVVIEAMSSGTPIITTDFDLPANVKKAVVSYDYKKAGNEKLLAEKILQLLEDKEKRKKLGLNARKIVLKNYSWKAKAKETVKFYREITEKGGL